MVPSPLLDFWPPRRKVVVEEEECVSSRGRGTEGPRRRRRVGGTKVAPPPPPPPPPHLMQTDCRGWKRRGGGGGGEKGGWDGMGMGSYGEHTLYYRERERWREIEEKGPVLPYHYSLKRSSVGGRREGFSPVKWAGEDDGWTRLDGQSRSEEG